MELDRAAIDFNLPANTHGNEDDGRSWRQFAAFDGDYYGAPDVVVRGVSLAQAPDHGLPMSGLTPWFNEKYQEGRGERLDDARRLPSDGILGGGAFDGALDPASPLIAGWFSGTDVPPGIPSDNCFSLATTTIRLQIYDLSDVGNRLQKLFTDVLVATITKSNPLKFAIKAHVFEAQSSCCIKMRTYQDGLGTYLFEFQRRGGDAISFNETYQKAVRCLQAKPLLAAVDANPTLPSEERPPAPPPADAGCSPPEEGEERVGVGKIAPLLDMAAYVELPSLQAESAQALAELARGDGTVGLLCTARAVAEAKGLLAAADESVAYPTAQLWTSLAQRSEAAQHLADQGVPQALLGKLFAPGTNARVGTLLATALQAALGQCAPFLSSDTVQDILGMLKDASGTFGAWRAGIRSQLKEAHLALRAQHQQAAGPRTTEGGASRTLYSSPVDFRPVDAARVSH